MCLEMCISVTTLNRQTDTPKVWVIISKLCSKYYSWRNILNIHSHGSFVQNSPCFMAFRTVEWRTLLVYLNGTIIPIPQHFFLFSDFITRGSVFIFFILLCIFVCKYITVYHSADCSWKYLLTNLKITQTSDNFSFTCLSSQAFVNRYVTKYVL